MKLVNIDYIPGKELEVLGIVKGTVEMCIRDRCRALAECRAALWEEL